MISARLMVLRTILAVPVLFAGSSNAHAGEADRIEARIEIFGFAGVAIMIGGAALQTIGVEVLSQLAVLLAAVSYAFAGVYGPSAHVTHISGEAQCLRGSPSAVTAIHSGCAALASS